MVTVLGMVTVCVSEGWSRSLLEAEGEEVSPRWGGGCVTACGLWMCHVTYWRPRCMRRRPRLRLSHAQLRRQPFRIYPLISTTFQQQQHRFQTKNSLIPSPCVLFPLSEPLEWPSPSEMVLMSPQLTMLPAQLHLQHSDSELLLLKDV